MGGKAKPNHPDYLTRTQASAAIAKALTNDPEDEIGHQIYRRIGEYYRKGTLKAEPIAGGRTKQFHKDDLFDFALKVFNVGVSEFKIRSANEQDKQNVEIIINDSVGVSLSYNDDELFLEDVKSIIHLYERELIQASQASEMIKQIIKK